MRSSPRLAGIALVILGLALLAWLLYDATSVVETLGLAALMSEAAVALLGLLVVAVCLGGGVACLRKSRAQATAADAV